MTHTDADPPMDIQTDIAILGGGPGGYTAAFRAADLGRSVVLVERYPTLGGVCLNVGCVPSKVLLHASDVISQAAGMAHMGIDFGRPEVDLKKLRAGKTGVVRRLTDGLSHLARQRKIEVVQGVGRFQSADRIGAETTAGTVAISFNHAVIACGSRPIGIPGLPEHDPRLMDSTAALELPDIPEKMLIVGGGIIGLEMAAIYDTLGTTIDIVELQEGLIPGCDRDLVRPLLKRLKKRYNRIMTNTSVAAVEPREEGLKVFFNGSSAPEHEDYGRVLIAVGRQPNGGLVGAENAGVAVDEHGFIRVDRQQRTNVPNIYAVGDVTGAPMLAHKATHEGKVAAEVIAGLPSRFEPLTIPSVAYTDPEIAWMGLNETEAKNKGIAYEKGQFPWAASGRALGLGREEGLTKLLFDPETRRILGAGIVGPSAGDLIGEAVLALEMGADARDIGLAVHPHPTLCETLGLAAEMAEGTITDLMPPRKRKQGS